MRDKTMVSALWYFNNVEYLYHFSTVTESTDNATRDAPVFSRVSADFASLIQALICNYERGWLLRCL